MLLLTLITLLSLALAEASNDLPLLKLPYGTWRAAKYDDVAKVYVFKNVRYGASPTGSRRFASPEPPEPVLGIQNGSIGAACMQFHTSGNDKGAPLVKREQSSQVDVNQVIQESQSRKVYSEDCLFLDLYVPEEALKAEKKQKLPVVVFVHGGAYTSGSKDVLDVIGLYDGTGLVHQSKGRMIVATINYRLGVFGWLGGTSAERAGATNLGLLDQRLAFEWVQRYIHLVGGDRQQVSAWGESAGGGSLMHHLVLKGGTVAPLFKRAQIYSAGLAYSFDRKGKLEEMFQKVSALAGCLGGHFSCLRTVSPQDLVRAQVLVTGLSFTIQRPQFGPVPDGNLIRQVASLELAQDDAGLFVDKSINTDAGFVKLLLGAYGRLDAVASIAARYPAKDFSSPVARQAELLKDAVFACNYRWITDAFPGKSFNMQFSGGSSGSHGQVLSAVFYNPTLTIKANGTTFPVSDYFGNRDVFNSFQSYAVSHAIYGSPNTARNLSGTILWPKVSGVQSEILGNVLNMTNGGFQLISEKQGLKSTCDFWLSIHSNLTREAAS
ncbi:hypothetical protein NW754_003178 [Fusarium falciforme]|uniref:Carboxylesterase type B domain-containing protein n=1 Tax=Fusarium falciforme TaxID=195108 RepID=A0A9W8QZC4_9HYPO|nr:hypothetical protein NW754_003178 [Fusarium falciforme]KAJ4183238.1 hypothetical protein NW755_009727 [Fusarium falciforme]KAJ4238284.1 hypothetical protein NW757_013178 [Fusarium falciforme]